MIIFTRYHTHPSLPILQVSAGEQAPVKDGQQGGKSLDAASHRIRNTGGRYLLPPPTLHPAKSRQRKYCLQTRDAQVRIQLGASYAQITTTPTSPQPPRRSTCLQFGSHPASPPNRLFRRSLLKRLHRAQGKAPSERLLTLSYQATHTYHTAPYRTTLHAMTHHSTAPHNRERPQSARTAPAGFHPRRRPALAPAALGCIELGVEIFPSQPRQEGEHQVGVQAPFRACLPQHCKHMRAAIELLCLAVCPARFQRLAPQEHSF